MFLCLFQDVIFNFRSFFLTLTFCKIIFIFLFVLFYKAKMAKVIAITILSVLVSVLVIMNAFYQKKQFYPAVVFITKSNTSMAVFYFQVFVFFGIVANLFKMIFFGELRRIEVDRLSDRAWYTLSETCLAFSVFREDFNLKFLTLLILLVVFKGFHWLANERVEYIEQSPIISWTYHFRLVSLLAILGIIDVSFVYQALDCTLKMGPTAQLIFGFEYAILLTFSCNSLIKYTFHMNDMYESPWENKTNYLLYTELIVSAVRAAVYGVLMFIMLNMYVVPLFALRPMLYTLNSFRKAFYNVILSQRAIRNMNTLYPDATEDELISTDNVCIICREEMLRACKKLPCNHIFHTACLRSWFQRQQSCPTCRLNVLIVPAAAVQQQAQIVNANENTGNPAVAETLENATNEHIQQAEDTINNGSNETNEARCSLQEEHHFETSPEFDIKVSCTVPALYSMQTVLQVSHLIRKHYLKHQKSLKNKHSIRGHKKLLNQDNETNSDEIQENGTSATVQINSLPPSGDRPPPSVQSVNPN